MIIGVLLLPATMLITYITIKTGGKIMKKLLSLVLALLMVLGMAACGGSKPAESAAPAAPAAPAASGEAAPVAPAAPVENWKKEAEGIEQFYGELTRVPEELYAQLDALKKNLNK